MKLRKLSFVYLLGLLALLSGCQKAQAPKTGELNVFAAASLTDALEEIRDIYELSNNTKLVFNFSASGTLQKQIEEGAAADVFISAGVKQMDRLEEKGLIVKESRTDLLGNTLVLIGNKGLEVNINSLADLAAEEIRFIAIGTPETVPAGMYAREALEYYGLWEKFKEKHVYTKDVKQAISYVESGNAEIGFVYASDALQGENTKIMLEIPEEAHSQILYPAAIVNKSNLKESSSFIEFLYSAEAGSIFKKYGFKLLRN